MAATWWILGVWSAQSWHVFGKKAVVLTIFRCKTPMWKRPRIRCIIWNHTEARDIDHQQNMGASKMSFIIHVRLWHPPFFTYLPQRFPTRNGESSNKWSMWTQKHPTCPYSFASLPLISSRCWSIWPEPIHWLSSRSPLESLANFATKSFLAKDSGHWIPNGHAFLCAWTF